MHIIGGCGSGKSYIAREISRKYNITHYELDNLVHNRTTGAQYTEQERTDTLEQIVNYDSWVVEGVYSTRWIMPSLEKADVIFILKPSLSLRNYRTIKRFFKTRLLLEKANYVQRLDNLIELLWLNKDFETNKLNRVMEITKKFHEKRIVVTNNHEVMTYLLRQTVGGIFNSPAR